MDNSVCADKIIAICEELKALLSDNGAFTSYGMRLLGKLQRLSLQIGVEEREDARLADVTFITVKNGEHVPIKDGKAVGGPMKGLDFSEAKTSDNISEKYGSPYPLSEISADGANKPCKGFSKNGLKFHKEGRHYIQYKHLTDKEYEQRAIRLLQKKCGETIKGYRCSDGAICRFNYQTGEYAKGYPGGEVKTLFYPTWKGKEGDKIDLDYARKYFERAKERESYD